MFWFWVREMSMMGHEVYISEYNAPEDFECIWSMEVISCLKVSGTKKKSVEKLFKYNPKLTIT